MAQPYHCHRAQPAPRAKDATTNTTTSDRNCADFGTWREAQDFFENAGQGDPHNLDADNDGIACESLR